MTDLAQLLEWMTDDLKVILTGSRWAIGMGYSKAGRGMDAPRGASLAKTEADEDKGPRYDLNLGDHPARSALYNVAGSLARAEVRLNGARLACGQTREFISTLNSVKLGETRTMGDIEQSLAVIARLCGLIESDYEHLVDPFTRRRVFRACGKGYDQLRFAVGSLERALNRGEETQPSVPECVNGGCKNMADIRELVSGRAGLKEGGLCSTCARMKRLNGFLPPGHRIHRDLDRTPWTMQNKRRANGMDNGDESLSWALRTIDE